MGTGGGPRRAQPTRARPGWPGTPWCLVPTRVPPSGILGSGIFIHSKNNLRKVSAPLEMCRIGNSDVLFFRSRIPAAGILPLCVTLHIMREKALESLLKALLFDKT